MREMPRAGERATHRRTDPAYAPNVEMFDNLTHTEIHAKVQLLDPAVLAGGKQAWSDAAAHLADAIFQAHTGIRAAIADGWRGSAAKNADAVVRVFEQSGQDLADVFAVVSQRLGQASDAAEALRAAVSEPSADAPDLAGALLDPSRATSNVEGQKASEHARQDVVRAMNDIYAGVFVQTGTDVPAFPDETDQQAATAPTATPTSKITGTTPAAPDAPPMPLGTHPQEPSGAAEPHVSAAPPDQTPTTDSPETSAAAVTPAGATVPGEIPASTAPGVAPAVAAPLPTVAAASVLRTAPSASASGPTTTPASAGQPTIVPTVPGVGGQVPPEEQRKRDERRKNDDSGDAAVTGLGAGAMGGLMGGALAAVDTPRAGSSVAAGAATARTAPIDDEDDEYDLDDLTFLEPSDDGGELIGSLDPTTPPVLGEWTEYE